MIDKQIKQDFPMFSKQPSLVYLDSAATSQKPQAVLDSLADFYVTKNANVHRGVYKLADEATAAYEGAREKVRDFVGANTTKEIVFTSGATAAINLVAHSYLSKKAKVLISVMEHHSNIVPWQLKDCEVEVVGLTKDYRLDLDDLKKKLKSFKPDLVAITHTSNTLGTINPIKEIISLAHEAGVKVLVDGAQAAPHLPLDVQDLDVDFYVFSGHKMLGPTGIGVLYAKEALLDDMDPYMGGGEMISQVDFKKSIWNELPWKFEAGTPNVAGAVGLGVAIDYINSLGFAALMEHEQVLAEYTLTSLQKIKGLEIYGPSDTHDRLGVFSFTLDGLHAHDIASMLDEQNIAVRAGHHCTMPLHKEVLEVPATARVSLYLYNTKEDIDKLVDALDNIIKKINYHD